MDMLMYVAYPCLHTHIAQLWPGSFLGQIIVLVLYIRGRIFPWGSAKREGSNP